MNDNTRALVVFGLIGLLAGFLASLIVGGSGGLLKWLISGLIGAYVGGFLLNAIGLNLGIRNAFASQLATATIGAIVVLIIARIIA